MGFSFFSDRRKAPSTKLADQQARFRAEDHAEYQEASAQRSAQRATAASEAKSAYGRSPAARQKAINDVSNGMSPWRDAR